MARPMASDKTSRKRKKRRLGLWLGIVFAFALVVGGLFLYLYPYPPVPTVEVEAARQAVREARREAPRFAREPLDRAIASAVVMERLYAYDRSRWFRFRRLEALDQAIAETQSFAGQASTEAAAVRAERLKQGEVQRAELATELAVHSPKVAFLPPGERGARGAHARAELALAQAAGALRQGDLAQLDASLAAAHRELAVIRRVLGERFERFNDPERRRRWQAWADATVAASRDGKVAILVDKLERRLYLLRDGRIAVEFEADLGRNAVSNKVVAGDGATPEGRYRVTEKRVNGTTRWYKALMLDYPNAEDLKAFNAARKRGEIPRGHGPGGLIEIHGHGGRGSNWTDGCVALTDAQMDELFKVVPVGTPVTIVGVARLPGSRAVARNVQ